MFTKLKAILDLQGVPYDPAVDFRVQDSGGGPYIAHWNEARLGPRPTQEEIDAVDVTKIEHNYGIDRQIASLEARITKRMLIDAAAGTPYPVYLDLVRQISALRSKRAA